MRKDRKMTTIDVLLVDDEEEFLAYLKPRLENQGVKALTAANGLDALRLLDEHHIDVVVLDVKMPGIGGLEVLRKAKQKHPSVEVILLSGHANVEAAVDGIKLGAFDYVTKPCDISDLLAKINAAHARKKTTEEKTRQANVDKIIRHPMALFDKQEE